MMIRAELMKIATVRATKITAAVGIVGLLITQLLSVTTLTYIASGAIKLPEAELQDQLQVVQPDSFEFQYAALNLLGGGVFGGSTGSLGFATVAILVLGLLVATVDFRYGGIVQTALAEPRRGRLIGAKVTAAAIAAAAFGIALALVSLIVLVATVIAQPDINLLVSAGDIATAIGRGVLVVVLLTLLGLAIGMLVRSQTTGLIVVISLMVFEPIVQTIATFASGGSPLWAQFLPQSLAHSVLANDNQGALPWWIALAALAALVAIALTAATAVFRRRDL